MSAPKAREQLSDIIANKRIDGYYARAYEIIAADYRKKLDTENIHILDLSKEALSASLTELAEDYGTKLSDSVETLWKVVARHATPGTSIPAAVASFRNLDTTKAIFIAEHKLLVCKDFRAARNFVTNKISKSKELHDDMLFGRIYRGKTRKEYEDDGIKFTRAADGKGWIGSTASGKTLKGVRYFNKAGYEIIAARSKTLRQYARSRLDIAHNYVDPGISEISSVVSYKLNAILKELPQEHALRSIINAELYKLTQLQASITFEYKNAIPDKNLGPSIEGGYLVMGLEFFTLNGKKAKVEGSAYNAAYKEIFTAVLKQARDSNLMDISGSNTGIQDLSELIWLKISSILAGKPSTRSIKPHAPVQGSVKGPKNTTKGVSVNASGKRLSSSASIRQELPQLRTIQGQFYSLASLQRLLDAKLAQKIKENMGDGTRRDILNYRTGRFANSAKVERMSQSREGMITAFYTYMRNPYGTFSEGGAQGIPRSRDPKLLISKSIREIAATQVANRMRAVLA